MAGINNVFSQIKEKHLGKIIYIDGWQTSCNKNYRRFPGAEKLHSELKDKEIAFVNICSPVYEEKWKEDIETYNIEGDNYILTEDQEIVLYSLLNYSSGTYNMIINKKGEIINIDADEPNSKAIKQDLLNVIEQ